MPAFVKFIQRIKLNYGIYSPNLSFVLPCGPTPQGPNNVLCDYIQEIVRILNGQLKIPSFYADVNDILKMPDDFGCAGTDARRSQAGALGFFVLSFSSLPFLDHPNVVGHKIMARKILEELNARPTSYQR